jgi:endonuclease/exonuclease/phosphatase family metal-dependent hydrolase
LPNTDFEELPMTEDFLLLGDFNFEPELSEYRAMLTEGGHSGRCLRA